MKAPTTARSRRWSAHHCWVKKMEYRIKNKTFFLLKQTDIFETVIIASAQYYYIWTKCNSMQRNAI